MLLLLLLMLQVGWVLPDHVHGMMKRRMRNMRQTRVQVGMRPWTPGASSGSRPRPRPNWRSICHSNSTWMVRAGGKVLVISHGNGLICRANRPGNETAARGSNWVENPLLLLRRWNWIWNLGFCLGLGSNLNVLRCVVVVKWKWRSMVCLGSWGGFSGGSSSSSGGGGGERASCGRSGGGGGGSRGCKIIRSGGHGVSGGGEFGGFLRVCLKLKPTLWFATFVFYPRVWIFPCSSRHESSVCLFYYIIIKYYSYFFV